MHVQLIWIVDVIGRRRGSVDDPEVAQHWHEAKPMHVHNMRLFLAKWSEDASGAVIEQLEVDDPTYLRAWVVAGTRRWRVILEIDASSGKLTYLRH